MREVLGRLWRRLSTSKEECKMILVVRTDVAMGKGKVGAQCAHAALECYRRALSTRNKNDLLDSWLGAGQPKIVLRISGEQQLVNLARDSNKAGLVTAIIRDAGRTQLQAGTVTVLGIGPAPNAIVDELTRDLKLL